MLEEKVNSIVNNLVSVIVEPIVWLIIFLGAVYFVWGLINFALNYDNDTKRQEGKKHMIYGILGMVIMFGVWSIIKFIDGTIQSIF